MQSHLIKRFGTLHNRTHTYAKYLQQLQKK